MPARVLVAGAHGGIGAAVTAALDAAGNAAYGVDRAVGAVEQAAD